ncbi:MFS general substrate transporter [Cantharellus anzutake]|uniref:MFS general substrate transporter n=1 Tax=Cantharellus anzutake TaxID=1750568 RepID=UPI001908B661|nr:MFS general substrate transporter [Cantharellus anzutake]KAF8333646.1 MFS general substrate transporter [Cantharellus anzutake]
MTEISPPGTGIHPAREIEPHIHLSRPSSRASKTETPAVRYPPSLPTQPPTVETVEPTETIPASKRKLLERQYFLSMCMSLFLAGWNESVAGPLLPRMQATYHVGYTVVSLIFICNCVGFISAALVNLWLTDRFGFGKVITLGSILQLIAYSIQAPQPPFPLLVLSYFINGFGQALQDAQSNGLVAALPTNPQAKMSILHAAYGLGAFSSPLVATQFTQRRKWTFHFLTSLGVAFINMVALVWICRLKTQDELLRNVGVVHTEGHNDSTEDSKFAEMMKSGVVQLLASFILVYVGVEVTIGGWIVSFIVEKRGGGSNAGYVSSGLTLGRMLLIWLNQKLGPRRAIYLYGLCAIGLEFTIWFTPSLIENALAVSFVGLFLGPIYPLVMNVASAIVPRRILTGSIGWIASIGQTGSATFPFILAVIAQHYGLQVLQPLLIGTISFMLGVWFFVPTPDRRKD